MIPDFTFPKLFTSLKNFQQFRAGERGNPVLPARTMRLAVSRCARLVRCASVAQGIERRFPVP